MNAITAPCTALTTRLRDTLAVLSSVMVAHCACSGAPARPERERWTNSYLDGVKALDELEAQASPVGFLDPLKALVWVAVDSTEASSMDELRGIEDLDGLDEFVLDQVMSAASTLNLHFPGDDVDAAFVTDTLNEFRAWAITEANGGDGLAHLEGGSEPTPAAANELAEAFNDHPAAIEYRALTVEPPVAPAAEPVALDLACPRCGRNDELAAHDTLPGYAGISGFTRGKDGVIRPEWEGSTDIDWDSQSPYDSKVPFCCRACGANVALQGDALVEVKAHRTQGELDRFTLDLFLDAVTKAADERVNWEDIEQAMHYARQHAPEAVADAEARAARRATANESAPELELCEDCNTDLNGDGILRIGDRCGMCHANHSAL